MQSVCSSAQRETTATKLDLVELMLEMYGLYVESERQAEMETERKGSIVRVGGCQTKLENKRKIGRDPLTRRGF